LKMRSQAAKILGYKTWAEYRLLPNMTNSPDAVETFLNSVKTGVQKKLVRDVQDIQKLKGDDVKLWDVSYYERLLRKNQHQVDDEALREYFPTQHVLSEILEIYQELLSIKFTPNDAPTWNEDVQLHNVHDKSGKLLGYFLLDLFPREGKYAHQCVCPLVPSTEVSLPIACNVGNLSKATPKRPAMLTHSQVRTVFHEQGHVYHHLLNGVHAGEANQNLLNAWSWSYVVYPVGLMIDFLECPSQALENWIWQPEILTRLSKHVETGKPLDVETMQRLKQSRWLLSGYFYERQTTMSSFDLKMHNVDWTHYSDEEIDGELRRMWKEMHMMLIPPVMEKIERDVATTGSGLNDVFFLYSWYHPIMGYDACYSSYLLAEVMSHDLFTAFDDAMNVDMGMKYRKVLEEGARMDANVLIEDFLGRKTSQEAFLKILNT
jgi:thimet oligopeptidase